MTTAQTIAQNILQQLGGNRFCAMTGAKNLVATGRGLLLAIGKGATNGANKVLVTLDPSDTYTVEFFSIRGVSVRTVSVYSGVYADKLQALFTSETGMDTKL